MPVALARPPARYSRGVVRTPNRSVEVSDFEVGDDGLRFTASSDGPVDLCFDGTRAFSFWTVRDSREGTGRQRLMAWPDALQRFLNGAVEVTLVDPVAGQVLARTDTVLGNGRGRVSVTDADGHPMGLDKALRLSRLFGHTNEQEKRPLLDAIERVLAALEQVGVQPFVAYGTLLGAVREQDFIGHDSDADLGYVSHHQAPADVVLESYELQRRLSAMGLRIHRYSGAAFKVSIIEEDGKSRGLDVFGGLMRDGRLYLMGEVGEPFEPEWLLPRSTATLAGREVPVPAQPERLLSAMYGPHWRVPDPAYQFSTPRSTTRRFNGWFRGTRNGIDERFDDKRARRETRLAPGVSPFARWVEARHPGVPTVVDLGSGRGADVVFYSRRHELGVGLEFFAPDLKRGQRRAEERGAPSQFWWCNFNELRSTMVTGADLVRRPGPRVLTAHHTLDALAPTARDNLVRMARMVARTDGELVLQYYSEATELATARRLKPLTRQAVERLVGRHGGTVVHHERLSEHDAGFLGALEGAPTTIDRMAVRWA